VFEAVESGELDLLTLEGAEEFDVNGETVTVVPVGPAPVAGRAGAAVE
jgi:hypothetical protein